MWLELNNELQARKENPLPEILLVCKILQVLPIQFETFKTSWMLLTKNEERKFEEMSAQLTMYERNHKERQEKEDQALVIRSYASKKLSEHPSTSANAKKDDTCNYCDNKGHWLRDCKKWISDGKPQKRFDEENSTSKDATNFDYEKAYVINGDYSNDWWIDNGATRHISNNRRLFKSFEVERRY